MSARTHEIRLTVNGEDVFESVEARKTLVEFLREDLGLTGSHIGCEHGVCGACTLLVDGAIVRGCLMLAVQCDGARIETIEGVSDAGEIADLQQAFAERNARPNPVVTALENGYRHDSSNGAVYRDLWVHTPCHTRVRCMLG